MLLATTMMLSATTMLNDFTLDGRDGKWLVHLTPGSVKQLISRDSIPRRINLEAGYDLYKDKTWEELRALRRLRRPRRDLVLISLHVLVSLVIAQLCLTRAQGDLGSASTT